MAYITAEKERTNETTPYTQSIYSAVDYKSIYVCIKTKIIYIHVYLWIVVQLHTRKVNLHSTHVAGGFANPPSPRPRVALIKCSLRPIFVIGFIEKNIILSFFSFRPFRSKFVYQTPLSTSKSAQSNKNDPVSYHQTSILIMFSPFPENIEKFNICRHPLFLKTQFVIFLCDSHRIRFEN